MDGVDIRPDFGKSASILPILLPIGRLAEKVNDFR
jgi:hypothetical protein